MADPTGASGRGSSTPAAASTAERGAYVTSGWVLFYAERVPEGPDLIGPFPSKAAALAYADTQNLDWSEHYAQRLVMPAAVEGQAVRDA